MIARVRRTMSFAAALAVAGGCVLTTLSACQEEQEPARARSAACMESAHCEAGLETVDAGGEGGALPPGNTDPGADVDASYTNVCLGVDAAAAARIATPSGTLIAAGVAQRRTLSTDGVTWQEDGYVAPSVDASALPIDLLSIAVGPPSMPLVAAVGSGIMTSQDGRTWAPQVLPEVVRYVSYSNGFNAARYGKGVYVVAASADFNKQAFFHSTDGVTWPAPFVVEDDCCRPIVDIGFGNDRFVAVGHGRTVVSDDGLTWSSSNLSVPNLNAVAYGNGVWVAVGDASVIAWSTDGVDWTYVSKAPEVGPDAAPVGPLSVGNFRSVLFDGAKFLTCVSFACYSSVDGKTWTEGPGAQLDPRPSQALRYQDGVYVGIGLPATILTSVDGFAWQPVFCGEPPQLRTLAFNPN